MEHPATHQATADSASQSTPPVPLPAQLTCRLSIKSGQLQTACRDRVPPVDFVFPVADGYRLLQARVGELFERCVPVKWTGDLAIFIKMSNNAPQKDYTILQQRLDDFRSQFERVWGMTRLRRNGYAQFVLMLFMYVSKVQEIRLTTLRRATESRTHEQLPRAAAFIDSQGTQSGLTSQLYLAVNQARLPDGALAQAPASTTFRLPQSIDAPRCRNATPASH